jgi:hypothetical protein
MVVTDLLSRSKGDVPFEGLKLTRRLNSWSQVEFTCDVLAEAAKELLLGVRAILLYQDDVLRFAGRIDEPHDDDQDSVSVTATDPYAWKFRHRVWYDAPIGDYAKRIPFLGMEAALIADELAAQGRWRESLTPHVVTSFHLQVLPILATQARDRRYEPGKNAGDAIQELAEVDGGFWFRIDPDPAGQEFVIGEVNYGRCFLVPLAPLSGVDRPGLRWEYGTGTLDNLSGFKRSLKLPTNAVTGYGAAKGSGRRDSRAEDTASCDTFGLLEDVIEFENTQLQATLDEHTRAAVRGDVAVVYDLTPDAEAGELKVPRLFRDFDVGDTGRVTIDHGRVSDANVQARVIECVVEVSDENDDEETITGLVVEAVSDDGGGTTVDSTGTPTGGGSSPRWRGLIREPYTS